MRSGQLVMIATAFWSLVFVVALLMLAPMLGDAETSAAERDQREREAARERITTPRCTCERCPIHGAKP